MRFGLPTRDETHPLNARGGGGGKKLPIPRILGGSIPLGARTRGVVRQDKRGCRRREGGRYPLAYLRWIAAPPIYARCAIRNAPPHRMRHPLAELGWIENTHNE